MIETINVTEAVELITKGQAVLIDVREPDEFKSEHIAYAMSVPLSTLEEGFQTLNIPKDIIILFQCLMGSRGQMACEKIQMSKTCENKIMNIEGGIKAWKEKGFPVVSSHEKAPTLSIFRQVQVIVGLLIIFSTVIGFTGIKLGFIFAGIFGFALFFAGITGWCGMAIVLSKMPWNN